MNPGIAALTDKEKQTLRLLLSGYDAKSMACHLGLSVHTINERLRDARRKLAVSSSREAARMLRSAEGATPDSGGDKPLGDAQGASGEAQAEDRPASDAATRRPGLMPGGIAMLLAMTLAALVAFGAPGDEVRSQAAGAPAATEAGHSAPEVEAIAAARHWLERVDARDWRTSYDQTASSFRSANTFEGWTRAALAVHGSFGPARERALISADETPAAPDGNVVVKFRARYANKPLGTEVLTLVREDGAWKVSGIYVG